MDHLPRLIAVVLLWFVTATAHAAYVFVKDPFWRTGSDSTTEAASALESCQKMVTKYFPGRTAEVRNYRMETNGSYYYRCGYIGSSGSWVSYQDANSRCTNGSFTSTTGQPVAGLGSCYWQVTSCPAGQVAGPNGVCVNPCEAKAGKSAGSWQWEGQSSTFYICPAGQSPACSVKADKDFSWQVDGTWYSSGPGRYTGVGCDPGQDGDGSGEGNTESGGPPPKPGQPDTDGRCPEGKVPGQVNGVTICVDPGDAPDVNTESNNKKNSEQTDPDGTTTTTSTDTKTECTGDTCKTTTTTTVTKKDSAGNVIGTPSTTTNTTTQSKGSFCAENKTSKNCSGDGGGGDGEDGDGSFGGSCEAGFVCEGDVVECAIAKEQHTRNCALFDTPTPLSEIGSAAATGENPADHPANNGDSAVFALSSQLETAPLFGGDGGCPTDVVVGDYVLPLSRLCSYLPILKIALHGFALFVAALIVFGRRS